MPLAPGSKLGSYEIVALIGAGAMGEVYRARDEVLQRDVALKILQPDSSGTRAEDDTLLREARAACALNNPQICTIYGVGESAGHRYIAMEFVEGQPLSQIIPGEGLPRALVFRYGQKIASALDHDRCLEKEPGHRYQRAGEVRAALEAGQHDSQGIAAGSPPASTAERISAATSSVGAKTKKRLAWTIGSLTAIAVAVLVALNAGSIRNRSAHSGANGPVQSLAVLPFTDEKGDAQLEYLDDGLTESLINGLSRLPQLKVMSRNAVFRYKGKNVDAQAAGNALKVDAVLTGTLRQLGDAIDINAELIDTRDNSQMWGSITNESSPISPACNKNSPWTFPSSFARSFRAATGNNCGVAPRTIRKRISYT
jgi:TolB-like protein